MKIKIRLVLLVTGLFFFVLSWKTVDLVLQYVIAPRAVIELSGWKISFSSPINEKQKKEFETFARSRKIVPLHPQFRSARAWALSGQCG